MGEIYEFVIVEIKDQVVQVMLIGLGKGNVMGFVFWLEMFEVFYVLDVDCEVWVIVIIGLGKNFSYGLDVLVMGGMFVLLIVDGVLVCLCMDFYIEILCMQKVINVVVDCCIFMIVVVQGWCIGGVVDLIFVVDIWYVSVDVKFLVCEVKLVIVVDMGSLVCFLLILSDGYL